MAKEPLVIEPSSPMPAAPSAVEGSRPCLTAKRGLRAVLVGAALVVLLTALTLYYHLLYAGYISSSSLPSGALFMLVVMLLVNALLRRVQPRWVFSTAEMAIIFSMLYISAALPQASVAETLVTLVVAPVYFPPGAHYITEFQGRVPSWLLVQDPTAVRQFYESVGHGGIAAPWTVWVVPLLGWSVFALLLLTALYCLSRAFVHSWVREERVSFPLMELPLELLRSEGSAAPLWRNGLMYLGAAIPTTLIVVQTLHTYFPGVPDWHQFVNMKIGDPSATIDLGALLGPAWKSPPLNAMTGFAISYSGVTVGISYLLSSEVAISIWLFHLLFWAQMVMWAMLGYPPGPADSGGGFNPLDWAHDMEFGAALALSAGLVWSVRRDVGRTVRALVRREDRSRLTVPPGAVIGFAVANIGMILWGIAAGASPWIVAAFLVFLYAITIAMGRMVAAGGLYLIDNGFTPQPLIYSLAGMGGISRATHFALTGQEALFGRADMSFFYYAINDSKVAAETRTEGRWHTAGVVVAVLAALISSYILIIHLSDRYGALSFQSSWPLSGRVQSLFDRMSNYLHRTPTGANPWTGLGVGAGILIALFLVAMNRNFLWWGLSPYGFVIASSYDIANYTWSSVFFGWAISTLVKRYGGLTLYRLLRPFFLGMILGEAVPYCVIALFQVLFGGRGHP